jgi:hypothetical protein
VSVGWFGAVWFTVGVGCGRFGRAFGGRHGEGLSPCRVLSWSVFLMVRSPPAARAPGPSKNGIGSLADHSLPYTSGGGVVSTVRRWPLSACVPPLVALGLAVAVAEWSAVAARVVAVPVRVAAPAVAVWLVVVVGVAAPVSARVPVAVRVTVSVRVAVWVLAVVWRLGSGSPAAQRV